MNHLNYCSNIASGKRCVIISLVDNSICSMIYPFSIDQVDLFEEPDWVAVLSSQQSLLLLLRLLAEESFDFLLAFCGIRNFLFMMIRKDSKVLFVVVIATCGALNLEYMHDI